MKGSSQEAPDIPYEAIDVEIRRLVRLLNFMPGIRTVSSCAGHAPEEEAGISFVAESQEAVGTLLKALPFVGWRGGIANNLPRTRNIYLNVFPGENDALLYVLRIHAAPFYVQRELIGEVEEALESYASSR
jgi:hypothetical protein